MTNKLSPFSIGSRFSGQPPIPGVGLVHNVVMAGIGKGPGWSYADSVRAKLPQIQAIGAHHVTLDFEGPEPWDMAKLVEVGQCFLANGITPWWYGMGFDDDAVVAEIRDSDPARYAKWLGNRLRPSYQLPTGINLNVDVYRVFGEEPDAWWSNRGELLRFIRWHYPRGRVLIDVWHRQNDKGNRRGAPLLPPHVFRQNLLFAAEYGYPCWWFNEEDAEQPWDPKHNPYQRVFLDVVASNGTPVSA